MKTPRLFWSKPRKSSCLAFPSRSHLLYVICVRIFSMNNLKSPRLQLTDNTQSGGSLWRKIGDKIDTQISWPWKHFFPSKTVLRVIVCCLRGVGSISSSRRIPRFIVLFSSGHRWLWLRGVTQLPCYLVTLLLCYPVTLLPCYLATLLPSYLITLLPCYPITLLPCYPATLLPS